MKPANFKSASLLLGYGLAILLFLPLFGKAQTVNSLDSIGNIGLGTTQPTEKLEVVGNTKISGALSVDSASFFSSDTYMARTTIDDDLSIWGNLYLNQYYNPDASPFRPLFINGEAQVITMDEFCLDNAAGSGLPFWKYDLDKIYFDCPEQGNLGVGTADPIAKLDVAGNAHIQDKLMINTDVAEALVNIRTNYGNNEVALRAFNSTGGTSPQTNEIKIVPRLSNWGFNPIAKQGDFGLIWSDQKLDNNGYYYNQDAGIVIAPHVIAEGNNISGLRINSSGYIGVGITEPSQRLEVGIGGIKISGSAGTETQYRFEINNTSSTENFLYFSNPNGDQIKITSNGTIYSRAIEVQLGSFPDHVFKQGYDLMPLIELERYIIKNKHLPDVPSEAEVMENGLDLGKMNAILLQKIEELTLHLIEQQKQINELKSIILGND